jgi:hypothetical protein
MSNLETLSAALRTLEDIAHDEKASRVLVWGLGQGIRQLHLNWAAAGLDSESIRHFFLAALGQMPLSAAQHTELEALVLEITKPQQAPEMPEVR